jgi:hypothetical protein
MFVSPSPHVGPEDVKTDPDTTEEKPKIPDLTVEEYQQQPDKSVFGRVAAVNPMQENNSYQCIAMEQDKSMEESAFYQDIDITKPLPILAVHCCMFIC